jgi:hypothetical protein
MRDILNQMRGERVQVSWPNQTTGTVVGVEHRVLEEEKEKKREEDFLNLFANGMFQSIPFSQIREIRLENPRLQKELDDALNTLAKGHDTEKKTVTLNFNGEGKREVDVSYIVEAPVWKTSYRLVLEDKGGFIQGWAIVENTGDEDWQNVQLSLVSGRPISFKMDLYQPLYAPRPVVQPELYLSLRPQVYEQNLLREGLEDRAVVAAAPGASLGAAGFGGGAFGRDLRKEANLGVALRGAVAAENFAVKPYGFGDMAASVSAAAGNVTGELFQYALKMPVSIQRQKSAMLPIVTTKVEGGKLSIYNESVQAKHPLNGFRLKNTSDLHLMQGPITVFDGGSYAGDARIEDLAPGQERLISYAIDLKTEVEPQSKSHPETLVSVRIRHGTLLATKKLVEEKTYNVKNRDQKEKTVLVEHPLRADWKLEAPSGVAERTRDVYRFRVEVPAGKTETVQVRESRQVQEDAALSSFDTGALNFYLRSEKVSERVKEVLGKVASFRSDLAELAAERKRREDRLQEISQEQARIRENMARLSQTAELYQRYVKKFDEQETEFERLRSEASKLKEQEAARQREFNEYLGGVDLE